MAGPSVITPVHGLQKPDKIGDEGPGYECAHGAWTCLESCAHVLGPTCYAARCEITLLRSARCVRRVTQLARCSNSHSFVRVAVPRKKRGICCNGNYVGLLYLQGCRYNGSSSSGSDGKTRRKKTG